MATSMDSQLLSGNPAKGPWSSCRRTTWSACSRRRPRMNCGLAIGWSTLVDNFWGGQQHFMIQQAAPKIRYAPRKLQQPAIAFDNWSINLCLQALPRPASVGSPTKLRLAEHGFLLAGVLCGRMSDTNVVIQIYMAVVCTTLVSCKHLKSRF